METRGKARKHLSPSASKGPKLGFWVEAEMHPCCRVSVEMPGGLVFGRDFEVMN